MQDVTRKSFLIAVVGFFAALATAAPAAASFFYEGSGLRSARRDFRGEGRRRRKPVRHKPMRHMRRRRFRKRAPACGCVVRKG